MLTSNGKTRRGDGMILDSNLRELTSQVQKYFEEIAQDMDERAIEVARNTGKKIHAQASRLAPVDTGQLRKSITYEEQEYGADVYVDLSKAEYGIWVELGTKRGAPQPYWRPALEYGKQYLYSGMSKLTK